LACCSSSKESLGSSADDPRQSLKPLPKKPTPCSPSTPYPRSAERWIGIAFLAIWIALAFWPARVAHRKGHSFIGYFIFSVLCFPLALLTAYLVHDRTQPAN